MTYTETFEPKPPTRMFFPEDTAELGENLRTALVSLVQGQWLSEASNKNAWRAMLDNEDLIRERMSELMLVLYVDTENGFALCKQAEYEAAVPRLMRQMRLNLYDSATIVHLRKALLSADLSEPHAIVDINDILGEIAASPQFKENDEAATRRGVAQSFKKMKDNRLVKEVRGTDERFIVSPVLRVLFTSDEANALLDALRGLAPDDTVPADPELGDSDD